MGRESRVRKERLIKREFGEAEDRALFATADEMSEEVNLIKRAEAINLILPNHIILPGG